MDKPKITLSPLLVSVGICKPFHSNCQEMKGKRQWNTRNLHSVWCRPCLRSAPSTAVSTRPIFTMFSDYFRDRRPVLGTVDSKPRYYEYHTLVFPIPQRGTCPDNDENNVKYHYGGINSSYNRIGRLMLREDGSGAIEYYYGKMGEVLKTVRTLIVPNQAVATYVTQWKYDSHNRLLEMIYPDEEKVTYGYNLGGQVDHVRGYKSYGYDYVNKIGYDKFEQRTYLKYCNGAETFYSYDPARRRLQNLVVNTKAGIIMDNAYSYDAVSNVLGIKNNAPLPQSGKAGGQMSHSYSYDPLYRLASATGTYKGTDNKSASYTLSMGYDNMHRITSKKQHLSQMGVQFDGTLNAGYELSYSYGSEEGKKFQLNNVRDINYRTEEVPTDSTTINNGHKYEYDANGNLVYINTSRVKRDGKEDDKVSEQKFKWDEENRLLAVDENGFVSNYWYDADGERTVKTSGENEAIYVNSEFSGGNTGTARFSLYVSPYLVAGQGGKYTKHIYIGSQRIVSKLGDLASYGADPRRIPYAGNEADGLTINYKEKYAQQLQSIKDNYKTFDIPYTGKDNNDYVNGQGFCCDDGTPEAAQARAMARAAVDGNFKPNEEYEKMQFYYHPDHLGSSSYITNLDGEVSQHIEYVPFGEVFIEERNNTWNTPYLFNAKELDEETGLYYYGARYMDPKISMWLGVDPLMEQTPSWTPYRAFYCNPIRYTDLIGLSESTHTDDNGNVIAVFNDNDNGVYKHGKNADGSNPTEYQLSKRAEKFGTSSGGIRMGETEYWDEFVSPETGKALTNHRIQFGKSFDPIIAKMHGLAEDMDLAEIASKSAGGQLFDIKKNYVGVGGLLNGKYATSRSAGNFLAGYNAEGGTYFGVGISFKTFQKLAGALHIEESNGKRLSKGQMASIVILGTYNSSDIKKFVAPTYGEVNYQYRMSLAGWNFGKKKK